jgi:hypothetical protein
MTPEDYQRLADAQEGRCAFANCERLAESERFGRLNVDHSHTTGVIRGLLCWPHNLLLGAADDDPQVLVDALHYLASPPGPVVLGGLMTPGEHALGEDDELDAVIRERALALSSPG